MRLLYYLSRVKRLGGILMITVYMLSFAELHNLLRIPVFFAHLDEHQEKDPSTTVWGFFKEHYIGPTVVDDDFDRDQQLPFRDTECCVVALHFSYECFSPSFELHSLENIPVEFSLYLERSKKILPACDFFQPPRCA